MNIYIIKNKNVPVLYIRAEKAHVKVFDWWIAKISSYCSLFQWLDGFIS